MQNRMQQIETSLPMKKINDTFDGNNILKNILE